jgi:hypothetical protein
MILDKKEKQPVEVKDYPIDYSDWLAEVADTISDVAASVVCLTNAQDTDLIISNLVMTPTAVSVWLSGGTSGERYKVSVDVTTAAGRVDQSEFIVKVKDY